MREMIRSFCERREIHWTEFPEGTFTIWDSGDIVLEVSGLDSGGFNATAFEDGITRINGISGYHGPALINYLEGWFG